jgi:hypothetical protein
MKMPGFSAESSLRGANENYNGQLVAGGASGSRVVPQGCFTINGHSCCCYFGYCYCSHPIYSTHYPA